MSGWRTRPWGLSRSCARPGAPLLGSNSLPTCLSPRHTENQTESAGARPVRAACAWRGSARRTALIGLAACVVGTGGACLNGWGRSPPPPPHLWGEGPVGRMQERAERRAESLFYSKESNVIRLSGAVNETVAFEFLISAPPGGSSGLEVWIDDLLGERGGTIHASSTRMYRHWPVTVERY